MSAFAENLTRWLITAFQWRDLIVLVLGSVVFLGIWGRFAYANIKACDKLGIAISIAVLAIGAGAIWYFANGLNLGEPAPIRPKTDGGDRAVAYGVIAVLWIVYLYNLIRYCRLALLRKLTKDYLRLLGIILLGTPAYALATFLLLTILPGG
ncbi:MAG: hypothetical protein NC210_06180 [[Clostridium] fimetarium]|nr:hypothetical protein [Alistipes timonensis]MCM1405991.1 hypothetical protein [[Clostridium] fimetarium]